jgi:hypothetical protein
VISDAAIELNRAAPGNYEAFKLSRDWGLRDFCKTGFTEIRRYDLVVKATLIVAEDRASGCWDISSDGFAPDWRGACAWASEILGRSLKLPPQVESRTINSDYLGEA